MMFRTVIIAMGATVIAAPLAAQTPDVIGEPAPTGPALAAVVAVQQLYDRHDYAGAVARADSAMQHGLGSTKLQTWRLASMAQRPGAGIAPMRTARRMASMQPTSAWAWIGLALTAAAVPDSAAIARSSAARAVSLAPKDSVLHRLATQVLERVKQ